METKKSDRANLDKKRSMFFQAGLLLALGLAFAAFEWQVAPRISDVEWTTVTSADTEWIMPSTTQPAVPPPAPHRPNFELEIVDESVDIGDLPDIIFNVETGSNILPTDGFSTTSLIDEVEPEIFDVGIVEERALFNGYPAEQAFRDYISQNLSYPQIAIDNGIFGKVFVQFVVDQKGNAVDVQVVRGVDPSLDNEALRLIKSTSGMWTPGRQRGNPVKVRYTFPISFRLQ
jgi:protein TonB